MEIKHRYFIQYMIKNGVVELGRALKYCQDISEDFVNDVSELKQLISTINREISKQSFQINLITCEVTNQELVVFINSKNDEVSKFQIAFSPLELEYFHVILQEILNSDDNRLTFVTILNLTSSLTATFSRVSGQNVLDKWLDGGYFVKKEEFIYLGPRLILEFTSYLKEQGPNHICNLCTELVFTGKRCGACDILLHSYCLEKYLTRQGKCPSCKNQWFVRPNDLSFSNMQESQYAQEQHENEESRISEMDTEEPLSGTSSGLTEDSRAVRRSARNRTSF